MSDFDFISDRALRSNIDQANALTLELVLLSESKNYEDRAAIVSSIRKTIIIYTATIVEALLLWKIKTLYSAGQVVLDDEWDYNEPKLIYSIPETNTEIVWCKRKKITKRIDRLDFLNVIRFCTKNQILKGKKIVKDVDDLRKLRNKLHIGGLTQIDNEYKVKDLDFCFSVLERVKKLVAE